MSSRDQLANDLAIDVVNTVWERLDPFFGHLMVPEIEFRDALSQAATDVRELLDPAESFDVEIDDGRPPVSPAELGAAYTKTIDNLVYAAEHPHIEP